MCTLLCSRFVLYSRCHQHSSVAWLPCVFTVVTLIMVTQSVHQSTHLPRWHHVQDCFPVYCILNTVYCILKFKVISNLGFVFIIVIWVRILTWTDSRLAFDHSLLNYVKMISNLIQIQFGHELINVINKRNLTPLNHPFVCPSVRPAKSLLGPKGPCPLQELERSTP